MGHAAIWIVVATIGLIHAWPITKEETQHLIRWDYWPPLSTTPYFSGVFLASRPGSIHLKPQRFTVFNVFNNDADKHSHRNTLLYGSIMYKPTEMTTSVTNVAVQHAFEFAVDTIQQQSARQHISPKAILQEVVLLPLYVTGDNGESEMVIVQEFKTDLHQSMKFKSHVTLGTNFYLTIDDPMFQLRHRAAISLDRDGVYNLFQHTFAPFTTSESSVTQSTDTCTSEACNSPSHPRILSFNVWNTNPSADVYGPSRRWHAYEKRLNHLVDVVLEANADIIGFQEVRYDSSLGQRGEHAQVQHLSQRLPQYQFVYQAAMSYINDRNPYERIEEGPAIFSRFPIIHTDYLLLSRNPNDPNDSHQRLCLHAVVDYPGWGFVDVYVTHLSLSEQSRELTMVEIWNFMKQGRGVTQVLLGDLNAEPQSRGIQFLQGKLEMVGQRTDLKDVFLEQHTEPTPRSLDTEDRDTKFTFPSDNPSKRIDFILYRGQGIVNSCKVLGQQPTSDTKTFPTDVGMLNANSPVYASDHRAVLTELSME